MGIYKSTFGATRQSTFHQPYASDSVHDDTLKYTREWRVELERSGADGGLSVCESGDCQVQLTLPVGEYRN